MKPHIKFHLDKDLFLAILVHYWKPNSTYNVLPKWIYGNSKCTRHAYLRIDDTCRFCKIIWILRAITRYVERLLSHRTTFTMLRNIRVQFVKQLFPRVPNIYRKFRSSDLISRMVNKVESLQNIYLRVYYPFCNRFNCANCCCCINLF